jgi:hypothetical protein
MAKDQAAPLKADPRFEAIKTDTYQYKIGDERCRKTLLQGYVTDFVRMPDTDRAQNPKWWCFVIHLTAPCIALDRDKAAIACHPGDIVLVQASAKLQQALGRLAIHPTHVVEVQVGDFKEIPLKGGKKMWSPAICGADPRTRKVREGFCMPPMGPKAAPTKLLTGGETDDNDDNSFPHGANVDELPVS